MPTLKYKYVNVRADEAKYGTGKIFHALDAADFEGFTAGALGLGDLSKDGSYTQALAAFFDLEGFTAFCNQVDSHLVIPEFLTRYLDWLFAILREQLVTANVAADDTRIEGRVALFCDLPFFAKFLGDGVLFLWDTATMARGGPIRNIVSDCGVISAKYVAEFLPDIKRHVSNPPKRLRCGIARGQVISVGDHGDYVGSCINVAARLQKLVPGVSFAVSRRGFGPIVIGDHHFWKKLIVKRVALRGIGEDELVYLLKSEYETLPAADRGMFLEPTVWSGYIVDTSVQVHR